MGLVKFPAITVDMTYMVQRHTLAMAVSYFAAYDQRLQEVVEGVIEPA
jgi:hypothetical protein